MTKNKVKYGLRNVHYAVLTEGETDSYGTPKPWPGAVNLTLSAKGETTPFVADDIEFYTSIGNEGYDGTLETALVPEDFVVDVLKNIVDANGVELEKNDVEPTPFALLFEFQGDQHGIRHVLYKCMATRPNIDGAATMNKEIKTATMTLQARPNNTHYVKANTRSTTDDAVHAGWYNAVYTYTAPTPPEE